MNDTKNICTCGRKDETYPSSHSGTCPVWDVHHGLVRTQGTYKAVVRHNDDPAYPMLKTVQAYTHTEAEKKITSALDKQFGTGTWAYEVQPVRIWN